MIGRLCLSLIKTTLFPQAEEVYQTSGKKQSRERRREGRRVREAAPSCIPSTHHRSRPAVAAVVHPVELHRTEQLTWHIDMEPDNHENDGGECDWKPKVRMTFDTEQEAYDFYNTYGGRLGFSIRRGYVNKSKEGQITSHNASQTSMSLAPLFSSAPQLRPFSPSVPQVRASSSQFMYPAYDVTKFSSSQYAFFNAINAVHGTYQALLNNASSYHSQASNSPTCSEVLYGRGRGRRHGDVDHTPTS
ncbi:unnamed protein product [Camellia sinensis]